jgi:hypothetical protein
MEKWAMVKALTFDALAHLDLGRSLTLFTGRFETKTGVDHRWEQWRRSGSAIPG